MQPGVSKSFEEQFSLTIATATYAENMKKLRQDNEQIASVARSTQNCRIARCQAFFASGKLARAADDLLNEVEENTKLNLNVDYVVDKKGVSGLVWGADGRKHRRRGAEETRCEKQTAKRPSPHTRLDRNDTYVHKPNAWEVRALEIARRLRRLQPPS